MNRALVPEFIWYAGGVPMPGQTVAQIYAPHPLMFIGGNSMGSIAQWMPEISWPRCPCARNWVWEVLDPRHRRDVFPIII